MDLEMTGLDPGRHVIVEIATLLTDDELNIIATGPELVIHVDEDALGEMDQVVVDMHTKSGLLDQIRASTTTLEQATAETLAFLKQHIGAPRSVPLCGNSIGMDRRFLAVHMPEIEEFLHYRSVDVSTLKELARRWYPKVLADAPKKEVGHRALDDVTESINELRYYRDSFFEATSAAPEAGDGSTANADVDTETAAATQL
ncbi:MAG: oligoribonuclease [Actinomycetota bacterium]